MKIRCILLLLFISAAASAQNHPPTYLCPSPLNSTVYDWCCYDINKNYDINMSAFSKECTENYWKRMDNTCCIRHVRINYNLVAITDTNGVEHITYKSPYDGNDVVTIDKFSPSLRPPQIISTKTSTQTNTETSFNIYDQLKSIDSDILKLFAIIIVVIVAIIVWILRGKDED